MPNALKPFLPCNKSTKIAIALIKLRKHQLLMFYAIKLTHYLTHKTNLTGKHSLISAPAIAAGTHRIYFNFLWSQSQAHSVCS